MFLGIACFYIVGCKSVSGLGVCAPTHLAYLRAHTQKPNFKGPAIPGFVSNFRPPLAYCGIEAWNRRIGFETLRECRAFKNMMWYVENKF